MRQRGAGGTKRPLPEAGGPAKRSGSAGGGFVVKQTEQSAAAAGEQCAQRAVLYQELPRLMQQLLFIGRAKLLKHILQTIGNRKHRAGIQRLTHPLDLRMGKCGAVAAGKGILGADAKAPA